MNEGIQGCAVHYYVAVVAAGQREMVLAFPHTRPRLAVAAPIFQEVHDVMLAALPPMQPVAAQPRAPRAVTSIA